MWFYVLLRCECYMQRWATLGAAANGQELVDTFFLGRISLFNFMYLGQRFHPIICRLISVEFLLGRYLQGF